jgi:hypothetical protein
MVLQPRGPLPASTYWRRRLVLLVVLLLLVLFVRSQLGGGGSSPTVAASHPSHPSPSASARPTTTASPRPTSSRPTGPVSCPDSALTLTPSTDARQYAAGATVRVTVTVKNVSSVPCHRDLGGDALEVLVYSGTDRIWSGDDCAADKGVSVQTLPAGGTLETRVSWSGKRSAPGCAGEHPAAKPGTYTVRARLGTLRSGASVFRLTA